MADEKKTKEKSGGNRTLRVGIFLFVAVGGLAAVVLILGGSQTLFRKRVILYTQFENINGLVAGAPVRLAGVDIGIVERVAFAKDLKQKRVSVRMSVDKGYIDRIRADSVANLSSKGLLGDALINITVGSEEEKLLTDGEMMKSHESEGLSEIMAGVQDTIHSVKNLSGTVEKRVNETLTPELGKNIGRIARSTAEVMEKVQKGNGLVHGIIYDPAMKRDAATLLAEAHVVAMTADRALARFDRIIAEVERGKGSLHGLIYREDGTKLLAELAGAAVKLNAIIGEVQHGQGMAHTLIYDKDNGNLAENLSRMSKVLRDIGDEIEQGKGTLGALLKDPTVYEDLKTILGNVKRNRLLRWLVRYTVKRDGLSSSDPATKGTQVP